MSLLSSVWLKYFISRMDTANLVKYRIENWLCDKIDRRVFRNNQHEYCSHHVNRRNCARKLIETPVSRCARLRIDWSVHNSRVNHVVSLALSYIDTHLSEKQVCIYILKKKVYNIYIKKRCRIIEKKVLLFLFHHNVCR